MTTPLRVRGLSRRGFRVDSEQRVSYTKEATVDLDNESQMRILRAHRGDFFTAPEFTYALRKKGNISTGTTATGLSVRTLYDRVIKSVTATTGTAPTVASCILDVHKIAAGGQATDAGTTIFTTQSRRPTIAPTVAGVPAANEVDTISATGTVSGGTYLITINGQQTTALNHSDANAVVLAALNALSNVAPGDVVLTGGPLPTTPLVLTFGAALAATPITITIDNTSITGGGSYTIVENTAGVTAVTASGNGLSLLDATNGVPEVTAWAAGDILRVEIDQAGTSTANLMVYIRADLV